MDIQPVSPQVASGRLKNVVMVIYNTITPIVYPLSILGFVGAFILLLIGAIFHSRTIKKMGIIDFAVTTCVLIFYSLMPTFLGLLKTIGNIVK